MTDMSWAERKAIFAEIKSALSFLEKDLLKPVRIDDDSRESVLKYVMDPLTVEFNVIWEDDPGIYSIVARTVDGEIPPGYYRFEGRLMRVPLTSALKKGTDEDKAISRKLEALVRQKAEVRRQIAENAEAIRSVMRRAVEFHGLIFADD